MGTTTNYGYNVPVGSDNVNLLPQMAANFPMIDSDLKAVSNTGVGTATELVTGTVHALTRADRDRNVFKFVATSDFEAGETFEVDGVQVTAKTPDGRNLSTGAYVINSSVLCMLDGTLLTVIVNPAKALDSENLDGHPATYFATAAALSALDNQLGAVSSKVGTGVLDVGNDCVDGINTLNTQLTVEDISTQLVPDVPVKTVVFKSMRRMGKLVEIDFTIVLNQALTHGNAIFGGVPKPASNTNSRFTFTATSSGVRTPIEFSYSIGYLGAFYPQSGITGTDSVITGHLMYITE